MEHSAAKDRMEELGKVLEQHNYLYYVNASPVILDQEFDGLLKELNDLESTYPDLADPNSPTQRVGGDITKNFPSATHRCQCISDQFL